MTPEPAADPLATALQLGLTRGEYAQVVRLLGREPSGAELGTFSVLWSEHCSYKSSRPYLGQLPSAGPQVLAGPGENAGVVDVGDGRAVAFKIESHNHPSFVEPYQGAATGVGGIIRDILAMGARPIALLDSLRFGDPREPVTGARTRRIVDGVVRGVGGYGNSIGVPTVGGELEFDPVYAGNPLVNVLCVGVIDAADLQRARAEQVGDVAVLIGQRTGRDGIGGASVLASASFEEESPDRRPNVQVGDPFAGNLLVECCLELVARGLLAGVQDMGAAGIACTSAELASAAGLGMRLDLDRVPLREASMEPWEVLCSESQERMLALVRPPRLGEVLDVCGRWGVDATPIGEVSDGDRLLVTAGGVLVHDAPASALGDAAPLADRPVLPWVHARVGDDVDTSAGPATADVVLGELEQLLDDPGAGSARWVWEQYDTLVQSGTVLGPGGDAAMLRLPPSDTSVGAGRRGVAVSTDGNGARCALDPLEGARQLVCEATRNVACTGATPLAITNCLNFGSPEVPEVMGAFAATVAGMAEACAALGTPVTGGNVSFYNQTGGVGIHPTPVIGALGVIDTVEDRVGSAFRSSGDVLYQVGALTAPGLAGSAWQRALGNAPAGRLPAVQLRVERALQALLCALAAQGLARSAHDVADGGLVLCLIESAAPRRLGARLDPAPDLDPDVDRRQWLFSESPSRVVVSVRPAQEPDLRDLCASMGVGARRLGVVTGEPVLVLGDLDVPLEQAWQRRERAVPRALGEDAGA